jgi:hypothetical protein
LLSRIVSALPMNELKAKSMRYARVSSGEVDNLTVTFSRHNSWVYCKAASLDYSTPIRTSPPSKTPPARLLG